MNKKHTPGPWAYICDDTETPGNFKGYVQGDTGGCIAHVWPDRETLTGRDNAEANARLIAAAPELLEACKAALKLSPTRHLDQLDPNLADDAVIIQLIKAVDKATGGAE